MASRREQILEKIASDDVLDAPGKPAGLTVHRSRYRPLNDDQIPAIVVYAVNDDAARSNLAGDVDHGLIVGLELRANGQPPDTALDDLYVWAVKQMQLDPTLGGLAKTIEETGTEWSAESYGETHGAALLTFKVEHEVVRADPEVAK